jgi:hypothetical protein
MQYFNGLKYTIYFNPNNFNLTVHVNIILQYCKLLESQ